MLKIFILFQIYYLDNFYIGIIYCLNNSLTGCPGGPETPSTPLIPGEPDGPSLPLSPRGPAGPYINNNEYLRFRNISQCLCSFNIKLTL